MSDDFDETLWNEGRLRREDLVIEAILELSNFMGCNSFSLLDDDRIITVKVDNASTD